MKYISSHGTGSRTLYLVLVMLMLFNLYVTVVQVVPPQWQRVLMSSETDATFSRTRELAIATMSENSTISTNNQSYTRDSSDNNDRIAIVWVCHYLDECGAARLRHLIFTAGVNTTTAENKAPKRDIWILHNHKTLHDHSLQLRKSVLLFQFLEQEARDKLGIQLYSQQQSQRPLEGFDDLRAGASKSSFLYFMVRHPEYNYAWHIENDVFYTGRWDDLFGEHFQRSDHDMPRLGNNSTAITADIRTENVRPSTYDMIATGGDVEKDWHWYTETPCTIRMPPNANTSSIITTARHRCSTLGRSLTRWGIIRLSQRFAQTLLDNVLVGRVVGHHEAVMSPLCSVYNLNCTIDYMTPRVGQFVTAGWGAWKESEAQYLERHAPIQKRKLYHPVKCAAYPKRDISRLLKHFVY